MEIMWRRVSPSIRCMEKNMEELQNRTKDLKNGILQALAELAIE